MENLYFCTAPVDDTLALESPKSDSQLQNVYKNAAVVGIRKSTQHLEDQMEDYCDEEVVLDSEDEEEKRDGEANFVNWRCSRLSRSASGREGAGLVKRQQSFAGYFQEPSNKVSAQMPYSDRSTNFNDKSIAGRTFLENIRYQKHLPYRSRVPPSSPDQKSILRDAKAIHADQETVRKGLIVDAVDHRQLSSHNFKTMGRKLDTGYDSKHAKLSYTESPEPAESQGKALDFLNYYISVTDLGASENTETGNICRIKSPPSFRSKGIQNLSKRVHLQGSAATKSLTFDWVESQIVKGECSNQRKKDNSIVKLEEPKSVFLSINKELDIRNLQNEKLSSSQSLGESPGNALCPNNLCMSCMHSNETDRAGPNHKSCADDCMEFNEQINAGFQVQNVEKGEQLKVLPDTFDCGLDTQMAAEAMEALLHASPPKFGTRFDNKELGNLFEDSSNAIDEKSKQNKIPHPEEVIVDWKKKETRSKSVTMSTVEMNISNPFTGKSKIRREMVKQLKADENLMTQKVLCEEDLNCKHARNKKNNKTESPPRIIVQEEDDRFAERENRNKTEKWHCSSESSGCEIDGRKSTEINEKLKVYAPRKRRKLINFHGDGQTREVGVKCVKMKSGPSFQVKTSKEDEKRREMLNPDVSSRISELNPWAFPKGKRTQLYVIRHSSRSSNQFPCVATNEHNEKNCVRVDKEAHKGRDKILVYTRRRKFSSGRVLGGNSMKLTCNLGSAFVNDNEILGRQVQFPVQYYIAKPSKEFGELDHGHISLSGDISDRLKLQVSSKGTPKTLQEAEGVEESKQSSKLLAKSPLLKELARLGYPESLPEFLPKESRRRRAVEKVCVLFSQNLEPSILKHQKKIVARLGFAIASCCSNATHFVTDRFVRSMNMLEAIALGKPVVTHLWLESCEQAGYVIDEKSYILRDEKKEKEIGFNMPVSLARARQYPILKSRRVLITPNVKPGIDVIRSLVKAVEGQEVQTIESTNPKEEVILDDLLVLSSEEDYEISLPFLEKGASIYSSELLLHGIVTQKLEYERFQLFKDFAENDSSTRMEKC